MGSTAKRLPRRLALREAAKGTGETPDPTPMEVATQPPPLTLREEMRRFIKQELSQQVQNAGFESFEEADDFEIDDFEEDPPMTTGYTVNELFDEEGRPCDELEGEPVQEDLEASEGGTPPTPADPAKQPHEGAPGAVSTD